ncbi:MAG: hypothetical protein HRT98_01930 [Mycoplasmatales bacterium]|nr:hypothetical protein [Mycoplasmatales bacterium]
MKKIKKVISNMRPKDWLMVSLWILTLVFLFSFVGTVTGLAQKSKKSEGTHWTYKLTQHGNDEVNKGTMRTAKPQEIYETKEAAMQAEGKNGLTKDETKDKNAVWTFDSLKPGKPTKEAKNARNAIAAVAFIFFLSLTAAIFTTAFIKFKDRKAGK